jgi:hypothetical protein
MSKWTSTPIALTAGHVAGTQALIAELPVSANGRGLLSIQSRSAGVLEFFFGGIGATTAGVAGQGFPLAANQRWDIFGNLEFSGPLFVLGGTVGEYVVLLIL